MSDIPDWLLLAGAIVIGYLVVSKVIDYFKAGSAWEDPPDVPDEYKGNWSDEEGP